MNNLAKTFIVKISLTVVFWCVPLILFPGKLLVYLGFESYPTFMFLRMLGWSYLALCTAYAYGLKEALQGRQPVGIVWTGIISNASACMCLLYYGLSAAWAGWHPIVQFVAWSSIVATAGLTISLIIFGLPKKEINQEK